MQINYTEYYFVITDANGNVISKGKPRDMFEHLGELLRALGHSVTYKPVEDEDIEKLV